MRLHSALRGISRFAAPLSRAERTACGPVKFPPGAMAVTKWPSRCRATYNVAVLDEPLVILASETQPLEKSKWESPEAWLSALNEFDSTALALVLPLELPGRYGRRGELWGVELLRWLRWSAPDSIRFTPVLAVAWQPLEMILRAKHEPLLVSRGAWFVRLPDVLEGFPSFQDRFISQVRAEPERLKISPPDLELLAGGTAGEAARLTHHDLANEGYSAWRLWAGYLHALLQASEGTRNTRSSKEVFAWAKKVQFTWLDDLKQRMLQPAFQQFQILRRPTAPPQYPEVEDAVQLVRDHAREGLPPVLRILLVDDEFDKGLADVLLKMLFGNVEFTTKGPGSQEWVYSETTAKGGWVRFACVKTAKAAIHWLAHWGEIKLPTDPDVVEANEDSLDNWRDSWAGVPYPEFQLLRVDQESARPGNLVTVILLDLRLSREEPEASYSPEDFGSLRLRNAVKLDRPDVPVVMLTASRQALNYAAAMAEAGQQDGWLNKEAPDVPVDDCNSANAAHYLLSRLRIFSTLGKWFQTNLDWGPKEIAECGEFWLRSDLAQLLKQARSLSTSIFREAASNREVVTEGSDRFYGYIKSKISPRPHKFLVRLVGRMVAMACLLRSADWLSTGEPSWNLMRFQRLLPDTLENRRKQSRNEFSSNEFSSYVSILFNRDLHLPGVNSAINALLPVEYEWLLEQDWGDVAAPCTQFLKRCLEGAAAGK